MTHRVHRRLLLVGEDFGRSPIRYHSDVYALTGASGRHLAKLANEHYLNFYMLTERTNVVELPEEWKDKDLVRSRVAAIEARMDRDYQRTILLGARVAKAFDLAALRVCEWYGDVAVMPHPSGRNRWYNDPANVARAEDFLRGALA